MLPKSNALPRTVSDKYTNRQTRHLRSLSHSLKPTVRVGQRGVTPAVCEELETALLAHELLKVKVDVGDRQARDSAITQLCAHTGAHLVQRIGNVAVVFRPNPDKPKIQLP